MLTTVRLGKDSFIRRLHHVILHAGHESRSDIVTRPIFGRIQRMSRADGQAGFFVQIDLLGDGN